MHSIYCGGGVLWLNLFLGGILLFHRTYEKTLRDKLENTRASYQQYSERSKKEEEKEEIEYAINNVTFKLKTIADPIQAEVNECVRLGIMTFILHLLFFVIPQPFFDLLHLFDLLNIELNLGYLSNCQATITVILFIGVFYISHKAFSAYKESVKMVETVAKAHDIWALKRDGSLIPQAPTA